MHIGWFKRDLRVEDYESLTQAAKSGSAFHIYILKPELWYQHDMSYRNYVFFQECLRELYKSLTTLEQKLIIKVGNTLDVLDDLYKHHHIQALCYHFFYILRKNNTDHRHKEIAQKKSLTNMVAVGLVYQEKRVKRKQKIVLKGNYHYDEKDCNPLVSSRPKII
jgi:deoxyribodipyrimidine photolyase